LPLAKTDPLLLARSEPDVEQVLSVSGRRAM